MKKIILLSITALFLIGCGNTKEQASKIDNIIDKDVTHPIIESVDYFAEADDKSWKLSVQMNDLIVFTDTENNINYSGKVAEKSVAQGANVVTIYSQNSLYTLIATIDVMKCEKSGKLVNVIVRKTGGEDVQTYNGCGYYRGAPQLHDIWALHSLNGQELNPEQFPRELPHFEINLYNNTFSGFAGCNQVNGQVKFDYNRINIESLMSTRMYCGDVSKVEEEILKILRNNPIYSLDNLLLRLETTEGYLVLKKVD